MRITVVGAFAIIAMAIITVIVIVNLTQPEPTDQKSGNLNPGGNPQ